MKNKHLNWFEKHVASAVRKKVTSLVITALGLFLALQYNETIKVIFEAVFPLQGSGILVRIIYVLVLTVVIVFLSVAIEKAMDGK